MTQAPDVPPSKRIGHFDTCVIRVCGMVNNKKIIFLMDTGASRCFMKQTFWDTIGKPTLFPSEGQVTQADRSSLEILGVCTVKVNISGVSIPTRVDVCEDLVDD